MSHNKSVQNENFRTLLATGGETYCSLAQAFLQQTPGKMKELETRFTARSFKAISTLAQQLGKSATAIGAHQLARHFSHLESASSHKDTENLMAAYSKLEVSYPAIVAELKTLLSELEKRAA